MPKWPSFEQLMAVALPKAVASELRLPIAGLYAVERDIRAVAATNVAPSGNKKATCSSNAPSARSRLSCYAARLHRLQGAVCEVL
jgi:hypothetical protein